LIKLFVNADDFGASESINKAIAECFTNKFITATTLMVNMPFCDGAVQISRASGFFDCVGLHLNISTGYPLSEGIKKYPLFVGNDGQFNDGFRKHLTKQFVLTVAERQALSEEFEMQMEKYFSLGYHGHLDSHKHIHTCWAFFNTLRPLLEKHSFLTTRLSRNINGKIKPHIRLYKSIYNSALRQKTPVRTKYFTSFTTILEKGFPQDGIIELMCHPDYSPGGALINKNAAGFEEIYNKIQNYILLKPFDLLCSARVA